MLIVSLFEIEEFHGDIPNVPFVIILNPFSLFPIKLNLRVLIFNVFIFFNYLISKFFVLKFQVFDALIGILSGNINRLSERNVLLKFCFHLRSNVLTFLKLGIYLV